MTKVRWVIVVFVLILAALATGGVFLYADGVEGPKIGGTMVSVVVPEVDIPAGTDLNELIRGDQFRLILIPEAALVDGAVTSIDQLRGKRNRVAILSGEQIPRDRIKGV